MILLSECEGTGTMNEGRKSIRLTFFSIYRMELGVQTMEHTIRQDTITVEKLIVEADQMLDGRLIPLLEVDFEGIPNDVLIMINGTSIFYLEGFDTLLKDKDEVAFIPMVFGG